MRFGIRIETQIGYVQIVQEGEEIVELGICSAEHVSGGEEQQSCGDQQSPGKEHRDICWQETPLLAKARRQLEEYLQGSRQSFDVKLCARGTVFQEKVWQALLEIPYGETRSYGEIAASVGSPKGARAVGMACNRNPILIMIPCHRVIGKNGSLTGFGEGLPMKEKLLKLEDRGCIRRFVP